MSFVDKKHEKIKRSKNRCKKWYLCSTLTVLNKIIHIATTKNKQIIYKMYRAERIAINNYYPTVNYNLSREDMKYIAPDMRRQFEEDLSHGMNMAEYWDCSIPVRPKHTCANNQVRKEVDRGESERQCKRTKIDNSSLRKKVVVKPIDISGLSVGDRNPLTGDRILPPMPDTVKSDLHHKSWKSWMKCWRKVQDMDDRRRKEWRKAGCPGNLEKTQWPDWTPEWRKRS